MAESEWKQGFAQADNRVKRQDAKGFCGQSSDLTRHRRGIFPTLGKLNLTFKCLSGRGRESSWIAFHFTSFSSFLSPIELELIQQTQRERTNSAQRAILAQATGGGQRLLASSESGPGSPKNQDWRGYLHVWY